MSSDIYFKSSHNMIEVFDSSVHLVVTSPPYPMIRMWDDLFLSLGCKSFDEMHLYLSGIWSECFRVLVDGGILCIVIGDATRRYDGIFQLFPNTSRITELCREIGFISLPLILWKKISTRPNAFLGSGFLPPNAYVSQDCENILLFRKGGLRKIDKYTRTISAYTKEERDIWFSQLWEINGVKQNIKGIRTAAFPMEIPYRLIRMFSCIGETVLDPFLGSGTTITAAEKLNRNAIGYEINTNLKVLFE